MTDIFQRQYFSGQSYTACMATKVRVCQKEEAHYHIISIKFILFCPNALLRFGEYWVTTQLFSQYKFSPVTFS